MGAACRPSVKTLCFELALAADGVDPDSPCIATTPAEGSLHDKPPGQSHPEDKQSNDMKSFRKELWFEVPSRFGFVNITDQVEACLRESRIAEGLVLVNAMHITGSVFINDDESGLHKDYLSWLERLAPHDPTSAYLHNRTGEDNADAHMKRQVMGREVVVAVTKSKLDFGPWEQIFYGEFDGRRKKRVLVKILGE